MSSRRPRTSSSPSLPAFRTVLVVDSAHLRSSSLGSRRRPSHRKLPGKLEPCLVMGSDASTNHSPPLSRRSRQPLATKPNHLQFQAPSHHRTTDHRPQKPHLSAHCNPSQWRTLPHPIPYTRLHWPAEPLPSSMPGNGGPMQVRSPSPLDHATDPRLSVSQLRQRSQLSA